MRSLLLLTAALLVGCSGAHETQTSAAPDKGNQQPDTRKVIVAFGDSLTAGFGADPGNSYPDFLQKEIDASGLPYRVVNAGISGETTSDALARTPEVLNEKPRIVIVEFGGNDGLRGLPVQTTRSNLDEIMGDLQRAGVQVVLAGMTLPPNYGQEYIAPFERMYKDLATKYKVPLIPFLLEGVGGHPSLMQRDGIHPTAAGNRIVAQTVMRTLKPLLK